MSTMAPSSPAAVLFQVAVAAALMAVALLLQLSAAAGPPPIGQPGCNTTCGDVSVPYPFGFGPSHCYWLGLNLTCDTNHGGPPRLLLGDGTLRVTGISVSHMDPTVRVVREVASLINSTAGSGWNWSAPFGRGFTEHGYLLSDNNELVVFGCNVVATLLADDLGGGAKTTNTTAGRIGGCASLCAKKVSNGDFFVDTADIEYKYGPYSDYCSEGTSGCCRSPVTLAAPPREVQAVRFHSGSDTAEENQLPVNVFVAEKGWISNMSGRADEVREVPFVLKWSVARGLPPGPEHDHWSECDHDVRRMICKSKNSNCWNAYPGPAGYTCNCEIGFDGNPYLAGTGGCQDINECNLSSEENGCFGECINTIGSMYCQCPHGTYGYPLAKGGCAKINPTTDDAPLPTVASLPIALTNDCNNTCGDVRVPYPFGFGPSHCYWPGLNRTCDTSQGRNPRLLLDGNGTLQVIGISLSDSTVRVVHHTRIDPFDVVVINDSSIDGHDIYTTVVSFQLPDISESYMLSARNEFIFFGNGARATLYGYKYKNGSGGAYNNITGCVSSFNSSPVKEYQNCSGRDGCCHAPIFPGSTLKKMEFRELMNTSLGEDMPLAFISEEGLTAYWWHTMLNGTVSLSGWGTVTSHLPLFYSGRSSNISQCLSATHRDSAPGTWLADFARASSAAAGKRMEATRAIYCC